MSRHPFPNPIPPAYSLSLMLHHLFSTHLLLQDCLPFDYSKRPFPFLPMVSQSPSNPHYGNIVSHTLQQFFHHQTLECCKISPYVSDKTSCSFVSFGARKYYTPFYYRWHYSFPQAPN